MFLLSMLIIYAIFSFLIYILTNNNNIKHKTLIIISSSILFMYSHFMYYNSLGYPVVGELPNKFNLLYTVKKNDNMYILITSYENNSVPRLYKFNYSTELEKIFSEALSYKKSGSLVVGTYDPSESTNKHGISFKKIARKLPIK